MINKRYKDVFEQYIYRGESTPFSLGTFVVCALCFLILIVATFTQLNVFHPWLKFGPEGFSIITKTVSYNPLIPAMIFIIYILGKNFSYFLFVIYLVVGFFGWPIFVFGGGLNYVHNYLFGYLLGFAFAILISGRILKQNQNIKTRLLAGLCGVIAIHLSGLAYAIILAIFQVIDFGLIAPIIHTISIAKMPYDLVFSLGLMLIGPYLKGILWICMKSRHRHDRLKYSRKRNQIICDDINQHGQYYN